MAPANVMARLLLCVGLAGAPASPTLAQPPPGAGVQDWPGWIAALPDVLSPPELFAADSRTLAAHLAPLARISARRTAGCAPKFEADAAPPFVSSVLALTVPARGIPSRPPGCAPAPLASINLLLSPARGAVLDDVVAALTRALGPPEVYLDDEAPQWLWQAGPGLEVSVDDRTYGGDAAIHVSAANTVLYDRR